jgi:Flp pilus assembly protein TadD
MTEASVARWENLTEAGRRFLAQGDDARAEESFSAAAAEAEQLADGQPLQAASLEALAQIMLRQQQLPRAEDLFRRALALRERAFGADHPVVAITLNGLAAAYAARGAYSSAEGVLRRALVAVETDPSARRELAATLSALGKLYFRQGDYEYAEPHLLRLLELKQQDLGRDHPEVAAVLTSLAALRGALGRHDHAEQLLRKALAIRERVSPPNAAAVVNVRAKLADAVAAQGRRDEAAALRGRVAPRPAQPAAPPTAAPAPAAPPPAQAAEANDPAPFRSRSASPAAPFDEPAAAPPSPPLAERVRAVNDTSRPSAVPAPPARPLTPAAAVQRISPAEPARVSPLEVERVSPVDTEPSIVSAAPPLATEPTTPEPEEPAEVLADEPARMVVEAAPRPESAPAAAVAPVGTVEQATASDAAAPSDSEERVELIAEPPILSAKAPAETPKPAIEPAPAAGAKPPRSAALLAAAAALAEYETDPAAAPSATRKPLFDPNAPLWPRADQGVGGATSRPDAGGPLFPLPPMPAAPAPLAVGPVAPSVDEPLPIAPPAATIRRVPRRVPRPAIRVNVRLTARQKRTAGVLVAALAGILVLGSLAERAASLAMKEPPREAPPTVVEDPPDRPVDEDDPSQLPPMTGDAIGWVPAPAHAPTPSTDRVRGGEVARTDAPHAEGERAQIERIQAAATLGGSAGSQLPRAPRVRVDLRAVDARVREGARAATDPLNRMPSVVEQP